MTSNILSLTSFKFVFFILHIFKLLKEHNSTTFAINYPACNQVVFGDETSHSSFDKIYSNNDLNPKVDLIESEKHQAVNKAYSKQEPDNASMATNDKTDIAKNNTSKSNTNPFSIH